MMNPTQSHGKGPPLLGLGGGVSSWEVAGPGHLQRGHLKIRPWVGVVNSESVKRTVTTRF